MKNNNNVHVVLNYISLGHHHVARLRAIAEKFKEKDWKFTCIETFAKDSDYQWDRYVPKIKDCNIKTVFNKDSNTVRTHAKLKKTIYKVLDELEPTIIIVSGYGLPESTVIRRWSRAKKIPLILLSDSKKNDRKRNFALEYFKKLIVKKHEAAFVAGKKSAEYAVKLGIKDEMAWMGSCVVDNEFWLNKRNRILSKKKYYRKKYELPEKYILCVARFIKKKNIPFLIDAYYEYERNIGLGYKLVLVGDGPLKDSILKNVSNEWKNSIILRPFLQADDLAIYYSLAACFVCPSSHNEQWGLVVNEAMASGLPVLVSSACGCGYDLVQNGVNGYIFDAKIIDSLVTKLAYVTIKEEKRRKMGENSLRIIKKFSCGWAAENLTRAVANVLEISKH